MKIHRPGSTDAQLELGMERDTTMTTELRQWRAEVIQAAEAIETGVWGFLAAVDELLKADRDHALNYRELFEELRTMHGMLDLITNALNELETRLEADTAEPQS